MKNPVNDCLFYFINGAGFRTFRDHSFDLLFRYRIIFHFFYIEDGKEDIGDLVKQPDDRMGDLCKHIDRHRYQLGDLFSPQQAYSFWYQFSKNDRKKSDNDNYNGGSNGIGVVF